MIKLDKILFPTDFSEYAENARPYVIEFAKKFEAQIVLLNVIQLPTYAVSYEIAVSVSSFDTQVREKSENKIAEVADQFRADGVQIETVLAEGTPFVEIVSIARDKEIDLIILATHGYGMLKHMLLGSTAERVVCKAPCPVMTVRHPEHEFVHP